MNFFLNSIYDITLPSLFIDQRGSLFVSKHWADLRHLPHKSSQVVRIGCIPSFSVIAVAYCIHYLRVLAEHPPPFCAGFPSCGLDHHRVPVHLFLWRITLFVHPLYMSSVWCLQKCSRVLTGWQMRNFTVIPLEKREAIAQSEGFYTLMTLCYLHKPCKAKFIQAMCPV